MYFQTKRTYIKRKKYRLQGICCTYACRKTCFLTKRIMVTIFLERDVSEKMLSYNTETNRYEVNIHTCVVWPYATRVSCITLEILLIHIDPTDSH